MRSNVSTLASTARPKEMMSPARPADVSVTGISLKSTSINAKYDTSARDAMTPGRRYQRIINKTMSPNPTTAAFSPAPTAFSPSDASTIVLPASVIGTGSAPELSRPTIVRASCTVKDPEITALPKVISSLTVGDEIGTPSKKIATCFPIFAFVISAKSFAPVSSKASSTIGRLVV